MLSYEEILLVLQQVIEAGCPDVTMEVYNARDVLGAGPYVRGGKDYRKAKVIYACCNDDVPAIMDFILGTMDEANARIENPRYHVKYAIQHYPDVGYAALSGSVAHSVRTLSGAELVDWLQDLSERLTQLASASPDNEIRKDLALIDHVMPTVVADAIYTSRYVSGITYRASIYDAAACRHLQANVGNVLLLSGAHSAPQVSLVPPRKARVSQYDERVPDFVLRGVSYYRNSIID